MHFEDGNHRHRRVSVSAKFSSSLVVIFYQSLILHPILIFCKADIYVGPRNAEWLVNLSFARHWLRASFNTASRPHGKIKINWIEHFSDKVFWRNVVKTNPQGCFAYICILFLLFLKFQHPTEPILLRQKHRNEITFLWVFKSKQQNNI